MDRDAQAIKKAKRYMIRQCGTGNECACVKAKAVLASEQLFINAGSMVTFAKAVNRDMEDHPNKMPFKGILLLLDQASTKPPHGSRGHRILVPKKVAADHLEGLIGMAVNYDRGDLDSHDTRHKVGIVTKAWITGNQVWVSGFVWKKDFPEAANDLKKAGLGMSMELANVYVRDEDEDVWHLEDFDFTGATILKKNAAAYFGTELAAKAAAVASGHRKGDKMAKPNAKRVAAASEPSGGGNQGALLVQAMKGALSEAMAPVIAEMKASNDKNEALREDVEELKGLYLINAAKEDDDDDDDDDEMSAGMKEDDEDAAKEDDDDDDDDEMSAKGDKKDDDDDDDDAEGDEEDLDAMEDLEEQTVDQEPGEVNKESANRGDKTSVTKPPRQTTPNPGGVSEGRLKSAGMKGKGMKSWGTKPFPGLKSSASIKAAAVQINTLHAQVQKLKKGNRQLVRTLQAQEVKYRKEMKKLRGSVLELRAQAENYANQVNRRSVVPVEIRNLLGKGNVDAREIMAGAAPKMTVEAVDQLFRVAQENGINIDTTMRAAYKNRMNELGLMESGETVYGSN